MRSHDLCVFCFRPPVVVFAGVQLCEACKGTAASLMEAVAEGLGHLGSCACCSDPATHLVEWRPLCELHHDVVVSVIDRTLMTIGVMRGLADLPTTEERS
jgi:hypothetical protein